MRGVKVGRQGVGHGVVHAQANVGEAHAGDVLGKRHALAAGAGNAALGFRHGVAQVLGDELDGLEVEHVRHLPGALGGVALDGVGEGVHAGGGSKAGGHGGHHLGVDHGDLGSVVGVDADELADLLHVGDDVVDGDLGRGAGGGGHGDGEHGVVLGGGDALERAHVGELGVGDDHADGLGGVHGGAAADGHDGVGLGSLKGLNTVGDVLDGGVGLDVGVYAVGDAGLVEQVGDLCGDAELHQVGVGADEHLLVTAALELARNLGDGAGPVVGDGVENNAIGHDGSFLDDQVCGVAACPCRVERPPRGWSHNTPKSAFLYIDETFQVELTAHREIPSTRRVR